ncbi:MAG: histidinol dehydrogenase [Flavobacteriales bacterium]|nr:histidinol dehydrogenase [Flavobacteriales bacterium]MDP7430474.1 histidinol dehydrogenase [Flavobacteriales bacterium]
MKIIKYTELDEKFYEYAETEELQVVKEILQEVKMNGDKAVLKYTERFDKQKLKNIELSKEQIKSAYEKVDEKILSLLKKAADNIRFFAEKQVKQFKNFKTEKNSMILGQKVIPLERVGCYVPGGRYPLPSSALMSIIPAKVAGVKEVIVCSPKITPVTIVAADLAGADRIFCVGGIQAIGAMAYGTDSVPQVDKIVGPGNKYVTAAKKEVYGIIGIDFIAGPSEVLIIADETGNPEFIAADLLAQAEHDPNARVDLITTSKELARRVNEQIKIQLAKLKTKEVAELALKNGRIVIAGGLDTAVNIANRRAPEHLEIQVKNPERIIRKLCNYGSLFIGENTAEVFGDYCSGTNHVLPTNGAARYTGGLSVKDFVKFVTFQKFTGKIPKAMIQVASGLAEIEGLDAHKNAADIRLRDTR